MKWIRYLPIALVVFVADTLPTLAADTIEPPSGGSVDELLLWADTHNPALATLSYEIDAARARIVPAGALPDPVLRVELMDFAGPAAPNGFDVLPNQTGATKYSLTQNFPLWGKRDLRTEIAAAGWDEAKSRRIALLVDIHSRIKIAYAQFYKSLSLRKLDEEILVLLQDVETIAQLRYSNGLVPQQDAIQAQVEKTHLRSEIINLGSEQKRAIAALNTALGRAPHAMIAEPRALQQFSLSALDKTVLQQKVQNNNPLVRTQDAQIAAAKANQRLIERNRYPDVTLGIAPTQQGSHIDGWEAMLEVSIPIRFDTRRAQESEARAMLGASRELQKSIANDLMRELQETIAIYEAASEQERLITSTLLPQAELTFRSALLGYENGTVDFATLLDAQRVIRRARQDRINAQVEQAVGHANIERMIGEDL